MHAMVLTTCKSALVWTELPDRSPGPGQIRVRVSACGVCRTPLFTAYTRDGGFATATIADARYAFPLGEAGSDIALAQARRARGRWP